jgi:hypothetical protein
MSKYRSARAVLAGAAVIALAGCGASASTSRAASGSTPAGSTPSSGSPSVPASAGSTSGTPSATSNSFVSAGSIPFPIAVGNTWVYQVVSGNRQSLVTNRVLSVAPVPSGHRVTMSETISGAATQTTQETYIFYANGKIGYPVNEPNGVSVLDSGGVLWPDAADLASGQDYRSVLHVRVNSVPPSYKAANVTVRGGGTESVTVPAGTYQATVVDMVLAMKVGSFSTSVLVKTWTAPGTGPVKSQVSVLAAGKTEVTTTEELLTFTKG